ncbi:protein of unknown function (plasmid) [Cupriavidus taiwanensis]|uniref:Uncharacterized protein n=1 Tax=Cupriavidus taiwanensis TaxID=164546 RepID=A0A375IUJ5_9BURK|nr:protein of unknown function [Cupriavidus taiwanensis]
MPASGCGTAVGVGPAVNKGMLEAAPRMERPLKSRTQSPLTIAGWGALAKHEAPYIGRNAFVSSLSNHES